MSVHVLLQILSHVAEHPHAPFLQTLSVTVQALPQLPQFCLSVCTSTQESPHDGHPSGQRHTPLSQMLPGAVQTLPQLPQFSRSLRKSAQVWPHNCEPCGQQAPVPGTQYSPGWHA
jgi:hypothetical protein